VSQSEAFAQSPLVINAAGRLMQEGREEKGLPVLPDESALALTTPYSTLPWPAIRKEESIVCEIYA
jgi:hypothetical protein